MAADNRRSACEPRIGLVEQQNSCSSGLGSETHRSCTTGAKEGHIVKGQPLQQHKAESNEDDLYQVTAH